MRLKAFRVQNYRSVNNSGPIEVRQRTALVGRNESGKTNLLLALQSLNAPGRSLPELTYVKDFPRDRHRDEFSEDLPVVETVWELTEAEREQLTKIFPRAKGVMEVTVTRPYKAVRRVGFTGLPKLGVDRGEMGQRLDRIRRSIAGSFQGKGEEVTKPIKAALDHLSEQLTQAINEPAAWASRASAEVNAFRQAASSYELPAAASSELDHIGRFADEITRDEEAWKGARGWVVENLPVFIYLDEYPELSGRQDIQAHLDRREKGQPTKGDLYFEKLMKVADLDPEELHQLLSADHEQRQQLANRAGAIVTKEVRRLWKDRQLSVRFNPDGRHFDTLVSDPEAFYPVEINLDERSRGFRWFFSFYMTFAADTTDGPAENAVLLLDEPGLHLHMVAQRNLLDHFKNDFENTIIYTTHSAFMIPVDDIPSIRTVNISAQEGTAVSNDPTGDARTLSPIMTALGYELTQTLFIAEKNLVAEGVSDYWYLSSISEHLAEEGGISLPADLVITPAGGAQRVPYMVALLTAHRLRVLVLLDSERQAKRTAKEDLIKTKLIREEYVIFASEALGDGGPDEADIEDLLDPDVYHQLVLESYAKELAGKRMNLNANIPRIVRRYEEAFEGLGLTFNKMRPAKRFLRRIADEPEKVLTPESRVRFEKLFEIVGERLTKLLERDRPPFE